MVISQRLTLFAQAREVLLLLEWQVALVRIRPLV